MNINIQELLLNVKNELNNCDQNTVCNICKLPTYKYNRITLQCSHIYHIDCIKAKSSKIIKCPYCQEKNKIISNNCKYINCCKNTINDSQYCNMHIKQIENNIKKLSNTNNIILNLNIEKQNLENIKNTNNTSGICNYIMKNGNCCTNKLKNNLNLCGIHQKKIINDIKKIEFKICSNNSYENKINDLKKKIY